MKPLLTLDNVVDTPRQDPELDLDWKGEVVPVESDGLMWQIRQWHLGKLQINVLA